jgi:hypothetical protein
MHNIHAYIIQQIRHNFIKQLYIILNTNRIPDGMR